MSWAADEWKDGLPPQALQKISQLETQLTKFKKDREQKQCQLESLEVALQNQKKKTEEEKVSSVQLLRDNKHLSEACEDLQKKTSKLQHDVTAKDGQISHLEAKMARNKQLVDGESGKAHSQQNQMRSQLEHLEQETKRLMQENKDLSDKLASKGSSTSDICLKKQDSNANTSSLASQSQSIQVPKMNDRQMNDRQTWSGMDWKEQLPPKALQHLGQLEQQLDKMRRERDQKQCQLDSLDQALQNQKRKTEETKSEASSLQRELVVLSETCEGLEQQRSKMQNELTAKENQNSFLTGQLNNSKSTMEKELATSQSEQQRLQGEVTRLEKEATSLEQTKRELTDRKAVTEQALQSHNAVVANLTLQLEVANKEKETTGRKLEEKVVVLEKLTEEVKALQDRANRVTEQNDALRATIMDKDLSLEGALNDADKFKAQVAAKDEQISTLTKNIEVTKKELEEVTKNWESRQKGLREDLETTNKRLEEQLAENQGKLDIVSEKSAKLQKELDTVRHCYTEQTISLDRLKQSKQQVEEEKAALEAGCKRLEEDLSAAAQKAREKDEAHATVLTNVQLAKKDSDIALNDVTKKFEESCQDRDTVAKSLKDLQAEQMSFLSDRHQWQEQLAGVESRLANATHKCRFLVTFCFLCLAGGICSVLTEHMISFP
ncbi:centromere protein F-like [Littorina saxatilis]|uniref:centromere protein F-like n=1 Tax=Littorina saxatilis TaxID=31220 RepID=UPI0038B69336